MALDVNALLDKAISHAGASGLFEQVNGHEPENPPSSGGLTCAVWVSDLVPIRSSGMRSTSVRLELSVRIYTSAVSEPLDAIDPAVVGAVDVLFAAYIGDFTLGSTVRQVDVFGAYGSPLRARPGYLTVNDVVFRVMTITLPLIVDDLWEQTP
ncbi:hypothetical protein VSR01_10755 [Actinacidiphila sp. DG2A-62]|uniref:hypothetical protein n=1 Tax=Actinacidiphila sp. DG2A-62 TaxID=3108821 RepID=UPI002DB5C610|nr:hypothetical protein [Actinacidiphila sp. DG2A-62]MEC3993998.1 hypothetical protein [Actinacidiphila sp. DG2A-62]